MTKKIIETSFGESSDWINELQYSTVEEAINWLKTYPPNAKLDVDWDDYNSKCGKILEVREETDEEYTHRRAQEAEEERQREAAVLAKQEQLARNNLIQGAKDVAFKAYVEKHKDNPNLADLSNLCMAVLGLTRAGIDKGAVLPLLECMERLEKGE